MDATVRLIAQNTAEAAQQASVPRAERVPALDAVRGLAILAVTGFRFHAGPQDTSLIGQVLENLARCGVRGVDLFFVLSGFLITGILSDNRHEAQALSKFYVRRALRIFPLYYAALLGLLVILPVFAPDRAQPFQRAQDHASWFWLYGTNVYQAWHGEWAFGPMDHFWSLAVEEHFYLVWPILGLFVAPRVTLRVCVALVIGAPLARMVWIAAGGNAVAPEVFTLFRLDALAAGALLALTARTPEQRARWRRWAQLGIALSLPVILASVVLRKRWMTVPDTCVVVFCASLLLLALDAQPHRFWGRIWQSRVLRFFGKYSYAMYVFQAPLIPLAASWLTMEQLAMSTGSLLAGRIIYIGLMTSITTAAAWLSWHVLEKHMLACRERIAWLRRWVNTAPVPHADAAYGNASS